MRESPAPLIPTAGRRRVAVFASFSADGTLPPQVLPYLTALRSHTFAIVVVCDNDLRPGEAERLAPLVTHVMTGRHGEYDFGSYKRGVDWARRANLLDDADDLILCNDSCFGPVGSFEPMFATMDARGLDVWGATDSHEFRHHLQSYWVVLSRKVFASPALRDFLSSVTKQQSVKDVVLSYELGLTRVLAEAGFRFGAMVENARTGVHPDDPSYLNLSQFPIYTLERGLPFVKVKALRAAHTNAEGTNRLLRWLQDKAPSIYESAIADLEVLRFEDADQVAFSVIMPTYNRAWCIGEAVAAVLGQTHRNFELVIVDDGSRDGTREIIEDGFREEREAGRLRYVRLEENVGVCSARNIGIAHARNPWIAYADSDNRLRPHFLTVMANAITEHSDREAFYARFVNVGTGKAVGRPFDRKTLIRSNFIDLGTFVHHRSLVTRFGGFDPSLRRLVDWDLMIRFTAHSAPVYIPQVLLEYNDADARGDRISVRESFASARVAIASRHGDRPTVSTVILSYNHRDFIVEAIESALAQTGDYVHEILISDDGSTDGTARIAALYAARHPTRVRDISSGRNLGVSGNYRHCFEQAAGRAIAILEGDDYWLDPEKNLRQAEFLREHPEATMVFSKAELYTMETGTYRELGRQAGLGPILDGRDFAGDENLNLIGNLSTLMIRKDLAVAMPSAVFQPRLNEIALAFYMDRLGKIGFMDKVMSVYRRNSQSLWTGSSRREQLEQAIAVREAALRIARPEHRPAIRARLDAIRREFASLPSRYEPAR